MVHQLTKFVEKSKEHKAKIEIKDSVLEDSVKQKEIADSKLHRTETESSQSQDIRYNMNDNIPDITDLSDSNRPTKIAEKCAELYDNQWKDAFNVPEGHFHTDEVVIEVLLHILQDAMPFCITMADSQMEAIKRDMNFASIKVQVPPVVLAPLPNKGSIFATDFYNTYTKSGTHFEYSVWPSILLHDGGPILAKGVAQRFGKR